MTPERSRFAALLQTAPALEPFARTAAGSTLLQQGIHVEAFARRRAEHVHRLAGILTGRHDVAEVRRRRELDQRRQLAPDRPDLGRRGPAVHWHGPDRVRGDRPVVVLLNGWTASGLVWPRALVDALTASHDVLRIDNRGAGWSRTAPAPFTLADLADDVADVLDATGATRATVLGLSMGGMIAQELALRHPARVERLVLLGTRPPAPAAVAPAPAVLASVLVAPRAGASLRDVVTLAWSGIGGDAFVRSDRAGLGELVAAVLERPTPRSGVLDQARAIGSWYGAARLRDLDVPTVVVHGTDDRLVPVGNGMRLAQLIPGARYVELRGVGHLVPFEAPHAVAEVLGVRSRPGGSAARPGA
jgi:pimeloyl-ACP methyl ester carboxylesterase